MSSKTLMWENISLYNFLNFKPEMIPMIRRNLQLFCEMENYYDKKYYGVACVRFSKLHITLCDLIGVDYD